MAVAVSRPTGAAASRADDWRALKFRTRVLTFTGNYATGGETITAASVGLKAILGVINLSGTTAAASSAAGSLPRFDVASNGANVVIRQGEVGGTGAAGDPLQEKTNAEAYTGTTAVLTCVFVGF